MIEGPISQQLGEDHKLVRSMRPCVFGEVLFDHFPDRSVLGGAPFNVAWNLKGLGLNPLMVSAIGQDADGSTVQEKMKRWGMDQNALQILGDHPTGRVSVQIENDQPSYEIIQNQAYDFVAMPSVEVTSSDFALLYHGSLAWRSDQTRRTLRELINGNSERFVDINIRQPHFDVAWLDELLGGAKWIKVNDEELAFLTGVSLSGQNDIVIAVDKMRQRYGNATYFVTAGSKGAYLFGSSDILFQPATPPANIQDTVGAGDAFAAMAIEGILCGRSEQKLLKRAVEFAAKVCCIQGATSEDAALYD